MRDIPDIETLKTLDKALYLCSAVINRDGKWFFRDGGDPVNPDYYEDEFEVQEWEYYDENTKLIPASDIDWGGIPFVIVDTENNCLLDCSIETGIEISFDGAWNIHVRGQEGIANNYKVFFDKSYLKEPERW